MEFDNSFEVPLPPAQAWPVLMNIPGHRALHAGRATHRSGRRQDLQGQHRGAARAGRADLRRAGEVRGDRQRQSHRARAAQGTDAKGRGSAQAAATFRLEPSATGSKVLVHTDLTLSGAVAQYGRGVGMIQATASALMNQFANNLKKQLANPRRSAAADHGASSRFPPLRWPARWCGIPSRTSSAESLKDGRLRRQRPGHPGRCRRRPGRHRRQARRAPARPQAPRHLGAGAQRRRANSCCSGAARPNITPADCGPTPAAAIRCRAKAPPTPPAGASRRRWASPARSIRCSSFHTTRRSPAA